MSTETKVRLVASVQGEYRLNDALAAVELPRSTWYYQRQRKVDYAAKHGEVQPLLEEIARVHPEYGYRRTTSELFDTYGVRINHKVVQRLHQL